MKIKHWQGYGSVNAKVVKKTASTSKGVKTITIEVSGNHEYGLDRHRDKYDVFNWLFKRFVKDIESDDYILDIEYFEKPTKDENGHYLDVAYYTITYKWDAYWKGYSNYKYGY